MSARERLEQAVGMAETASSMLLNGATDMEAIGALQRDAEVTALASIALSLSVIASELYENLEGVRTALQSLQER